VPAIHALGKAGNLVFFLFFLCFLHAQPHMYIYITNPFVYITIHIYITHETYRSPQISQIHIDMTNLTLRPT
jgi:hypothetical protein